MLRGRAVRCPAWRQRFRRIDCSSTPARPQPSLRSSGSRCFRCAVAPIGLHLSVQPRRNIQDLATARSSMSHTRARPSHKCRTRSQDCRRFMHRSPLRKLPPKWHLIDTPELLASCVRHQRPVACPKIHGDGHAHHVAAMASRTGRSACRSIRTTLSQVCQGRARHIRTGVAGSPPLLLANGFRRERVGRENRFAIRRHDFILSIG